MYDDFEKSADSGRPVELFEFQNNNLFWRYTSADETISWSGTDWNPGNIERGKIIQSQEGIRTQLKLKVPRDFPVAQQYRQLIPLFETTLTIRRLHRDDPDEETKIIWLGKVFDVLWPPGKGEAAVTCEPDIGSLKSEAMRGRWQIGCNHSIYDEFCSLEFVTWSSSFSVGALSANKLQATLPGLGAASPSSDYWVGGLLRLGANQFNMMLGHSGDVLSLWRYMPDLSVGDTVLIAPGCQNLKTKCISVFNNYNNYLGAPDVPLKDIFAGDGVKGTI